MCCGILKFLSLAWIFSLVAVVFSLVLPPTVTWEAQALTISMLVYVAEALSLHFPECNIMLIMYQIFMRYKTWTGYGLFLSYYKHIHVWMCAYLCVNRGR